MPSNHLKGMGCYKCGKICMAKTQAKTTNNFINDAIKIHGDKYDYSKVNYVNAKTKIIILCKIHGEFEQKPNSHLQGVGCPLCVNKTEGKLYDILIQSYPSLTTQFKQEWCKKIYNLPFDFCIPEYKIIIELDGSQHFRQVSNWSSPKEQFENDKYKEKCANDNGYSVVRVLQKDVFYDTYNWSTKLCEIIEELKNGDEIVNVYLCKNNEYNDY